VALLVPKCTCLFDGARLMPQAERLEKPRSGLAGFAPHCPTAQLGGVILITSIYGPVN
jgi:hypothetical protein